MAKEEDTIWRLTEADFHKIGIEKGYSEEEIDAVISIARYSFNISSWAEHVAMFFENHKKE